MNALMLSNLSFTVCLLAGILIVDISIHFKKNTILKALVLALITCLFIHNLTIICRWGAFLAETTRLATGIFSLNILYVLYKQHLDRKIIIISILVLCVLVLNLFIQNNDFYLKNSLLQLLVTVKNVSIAVFVCLFVMVCKKLILSFSTNNIYSKKVKDWIKIAIAIFSLAIVNAVLKIIFPSYFLIAKNISVLLHLLVCVLIIYRPSFLSITEFTFKPRKIFTINNLGINEEKFIFHFYKNQYYLRKDTYVNEFAEILNVSTAALTAYIHQTRKMSFSDLVNKKRIDHFVMLAGDSEQLSNSIEGMYETAGFKSRNSLDLHFKKFHGGNPTDLIRKYE